MINTHYLGEGRHEQVKNVLFLLEIPPPQRNKGELLQKIVIVTAKNMFQK